MALNSYDLALGGTAAVLAGGAYLGHRNLNQDEPGGDRAARGAMYAGGLGVAALLSSPFWHGREKAIGKGIGNFWTKGLSAKYQANLAGGKGIMAQARAIPKRAYIGAGSVIGASVAGEDHRTAGAVVGAGAGAAVRPVLGAVSKYQKMGKFGKNATFMAGAAALTGIAAMAGGAMNSDAQETAGIETPTGEVDYVSPGEAAQHDAGVRRRLRNINASGDIVFGAHNSRH